MALSLSGGGVTANGYTTTGRIGAGTFSFWSYRNTASDANTTYMLGIGGVSSMGIYHHPGSSTYRWGIPGTGTDGVWSVPRPSGDAWHHILWTKASSTAAPVIYIDGVSQTVTEVTAPGGAPSSSDTGTVIFGYATTVNLTWDGRLAEILLMNAVLTSNIGGLAASLAAGASPLNVLEGANIINYHPLIFNEIDHMVTKTVTLTGSVAWGLHPPQVVRARGFNIPTMLPSLGQPMYTRRGGLWAPTNPARKVGGVSG